MNLAGELTSEADLNLAPSRYGASENPTKPQPVFSARICLKKFLDGKAYGPDAIGDGMKRPFKIVKSSLTDTPNARERSSFPWVGYASRGKKRFLTRSSFAEGCMVGGPAPTLAMVLAAIEQRRGLVGNWDKGAGASHR